MDKFIDKAILIYRQTEAMKIIELLMDEFGLDLPVGALGVVHNRIDELQEKIKVIDNE